MRVGFGCFNSSSETSFLPRTERGGVAQRHHAIISLLALTTASTSETADFSSDAAGCETTEGSSEEHRELGISEVIIVLEIPQSSQQEGGWLEQSCEEGCNLG